ncbi:hypothetical protein GDO81_016663 [Engystomops pustulosus]|uniref:Zinc finger protein 750-like zinc finger domain-containing protein n=1 Tax=Engystomops pustulosus TaxID=76066 RepID=A0AAV7AG04_ENGPU|nr:hypothetical protein GDO81_016663 [Engystomops pustulosus]
MSKEEEAGCKLNSTCKHKERKPKKPHYIPRPWGKPYNYKCFQCPFTCMEKSHLYNHMKYSLCKNSLSLLIESDWPYKKNSFLVPEMNLHETHTEGNHDKQEACDSTGGSTKVMQVSEKTSSEIQRFLEEDEEKPEEEEEEVEDKSRKIKNTASSHTTITKNETGVKNKTTKKDGEPEFIITDVFSLEGQYEKEKDEQRFVKASRKASSNFGGSRVDQWKLLTNTLKKAGADTPVGCNGTNIIPCYPPPTYSDYQEHQGLSLLGLNYPLNTNLFSYLNPTMTSGTAQLPFLASTAQLMHTPHTTHFQTLQNTERTSFLPRFYYPLLFEHAFNTDTKTATSKSMNQGQQPNTFIGTLKPKTPVDPSKTCPNKSEDGNTTISWVAGEKLQNPTMVRNKPEVETKLVPQTVRDIIQHQKDILGAYGVQTSRNSEVSTQKSDIEGSTWEKMNPSRCVKRKSWLDRDGPTVPSEQISSLGEGEKTFHYSTRTPITSPDLWREKSPILEATAKRRRPSEPSSEKSEPVVVNASLLLGDLSRTLEEYGKVERKLANLTSDESSRQKTLGEQLGKIRLELLHIHQALEKASCSHDGPLDLSIKRAEDIDKEEAEKIPLRGDPQTPTPIECSPKQVVKVELLPPELVTCYARPTKCEADSSVLLCPDGRVGSAGIVQSHVALQEEGGGGIGFGRARLQMENI